MGASLVVLASIDELFPCSYAKILDAWPFLLGFEVTREREREQNTNFTNFGSQWFVSGENQKRSIKVRYSRPRMQCYSSVASKHLQFIEHCDDQDDDDHDHDDQVNPKPYPDNYDHQDHPDDQD